MLSTLLLATTLFLGADTWLPDDYLLRNIGQHVFPTFPKDTLPIAVPPFEEHVRGEVPEISAAEAAQARAINRTHEQTVLLLKEPPSKMPDGATVNARVPVPGSVVTLDSGEYDQEVWAGTDTGLYRHAVGTKGFVRWETYGVDGPLSTQISALATDGAMLWVGTPLGLSARDGDGRWRHIRGSEGLPIENITALYTSRPGELWIGTNQGAILYRPNAEGRQWFYRAGKRYLPNDNVRSIVAMNGGSPVYFLTDAGVSKIEVKTTTLLERAKTIEDLVNKRHRREGMVAACVLDDPEHPTSHTIHDNDNDGLWTAYHVAAMSLCYGATKDEAAKKSAMEGMHALYMLQNASGIPGLPARSVVSIEEGKKKDKQWQPSPDGVHYWKSDTSSDEVDGHYMAFYTYFEHIAQHDPAERKLIDKQVREMTDYICGHDYQLIDWTGKRTRWGNWNPRSLNYEPSEFGETGLNSLQMLSFIKTAAYVTGDKKYDEHYRHLAVDEHYLQNVMMSKKAWPLENNHSDDQLGFVAWYPILQLEKDPKARQALLRGVGYHYEVVRPEKPSFYTFAYATINPGGADFAGAIENLKNIPTDRRTWEQKNMGRADVEISPWPNRFNKPVLTRALPPDERCFEKWNADPYVPDGGGDGRYEDDGAAFLLPYWMGRYHGFIAEQQ